MGKIHQGTIDFFNQVKGYGFIKDDEGESYFVHISEYVDEGDGGLDRGDRVEYALGPGRDGKPMAVDVRVI
ncbi:MAG: cold shock domain-containing protein [Thermodesulfobacteriota bacterium]